MTNLQSVLELDAQLEAYKLSKENHKRMQTQNIIGNLISAIQQKTGVDCSVASVDISKALTQAKEQAIDRAIESFRQVVDSETYEWDGGVSKTAQIKQHTLTCLALQETK